MLFVLGPEGINRISVFKDGKLVFSATAGRSGVEKSAYYDYIGFASRTIGAAYVCVDSAAARIADLGYITEMDVNGTVRRVGHADDSSSYADGSKAKAAISEGKQL